MPSIAADVFSDDWRAEVDVVAQQCGWTVVSAADDPTADAYVVERRRGEWSGRVSWAGKKAKVESRPLCLVAGGGYEADLLMGDLQNALIEFEWIPASALRIEASPVHGWARRPFYDWLANLTPAMPVIGLECVGDPRQGLSLARLSLRAGLLELLSAEPDEMRRLTPVQFEALVCDRLDAMGYEPTPVGHTSMADGGVDIVAVSRMAPFPQVLAVQVKHRSGSAPVGPGAVRELEGVAGRYEFSLGVLVTNARFTADARWVAAQRRTLIQLRDKDDLVAWLHGQFTEHDAYFVPSSIQLRPGLVVPIPWPRNVPGTSRP